MRITSVVALFGDLPEAELANWVARGWVLPDPGGDAPASKAADDLTGDRAGDRAVDTRGDAEDAPGWEFLEIDVARVRLIHDLRRALAIDEDTMPLVLSLLDQVYALRGTLRDVLRAVERQPEAVQASVLAALRRG